MGCQHSLHWCLDSVCIVKLRATNIHTQIIQVDVAGVQLRPVRKACYRVTALPLYTAKRPGKKKKIGIVISLHLLRASGRQPVYLHGTPSSSIVYALPIAALEVVVSKCPLQKVYPQTRYSAKLAVQYTLMVLTKTGRMDEWGTWKTGAEVLRSPTFATLYNTYTLTCSRFCCSDSK